MVASAGKNKLKDLSLKIISHDLNRDEIIDIGWFKNKLNSENLAVLDLSAYEVRIDGINSDDLRYEHAVSKLKSLLKSLVLKFPGRVYLFVAEHSVRPASRVRSYKGVLPKPLPREMDDSVEVEYEVGEKNSLIAGIGSVHVFNLDQMFELGRTWHNAFFIISSKNKYEILNKDYVAEIIKCIELKTVWLNYGQVMEAILDGNTCIGYLGLSPGEHYVNFSLFSSDSFAMNVRAVLGDFVGFEKQ